MRQPLHQFSTLHAGIIIHEALFEGSSALLMLFKERRQRAHAVKGFLADGFVGNPRSKLFLDARHNQKDIQAVQIVSSSEQRRARIHGHGWIKLQVSAENCREAVNGLW